MRDQIWHDLSNLVTVQIETYQLLVLFWESSTLYKSVAASERLFFLVNWCCLFLSSQAKPLQVRALTQYKAGKDGELTYRADDIITVLDSK